jgi:farnesyl-diphosphate farnesyltransferase
VAYLLFRVADTLEDATRWPPSRRIAELSRFVDLLRTPSGAERVAASWSDDAPIEHPGYIELLAALPELLAAWRALAAPARDLVGRHTRRTVAAMQEFVRRAEGRESLQLEDLQDLRGYCYAVAGIVGEMLTELFLLDRPSLAEAAPFLRERAARFGEALQLVNILRDAGGDAAEGRSYLPPAVPRAEIFALARADLDVAAAYVARIQAAGAPRGVVSFCALPVLLARATLARVERDGPGAKITRAEAAEIVHGLEAALDAGRPCPTLL